MDMPQFDRYNCTDREFRSVKLYEGGKMPGETDEFYRQKSAYKTLNLLMMAGRDLWCKRRYGRSLHLACIGTRITIWH